MKKILLAVAVASLLAACGGGGNGQGTTAGVPAGPAVAGQGDPFVSAVLAVINTANADTLDTDSSGPTYDNTALTTNDFSVPDTLV